MKLQPFTLFLAALGDLNRNAEATKELIHHFDVQMAHTAQVEMIPPMAPLVSYTPALIHADAVDRSPLLREYLKPQRQQAVEYLRVLAARAIECAELLAEVDEKPRPMSIETPYEDGGIE